MPLRRRSPGGSGVPGDAVQNRKMAENLLQIPYRGVAGTIHYHRQWQVATEYPDQMHDPSLAMPHSIKCRTTLASWR